MTAPMILLLAAAPVEQSQEAGGTEFILPPAYEIFWAALIVLLIVLVVGRYGLPRIYKLLDERAQRIEEGLALAEEAKGSQKDAELRAERLVEDARLEAARIRDQAHAEAKAIIDQARSAAQEEAGKAIDAAQRQIQADKRAAQISLCGEVGILATTLAERIIGEQLKDTDLSSRVIDRFMNELETAPDGVLGQESAVATKGIW